VNVREWLFEFIPSKAPLTYNLDLKPLLDIIKESENAMMLRRSKSA
jgi:hypothetical protein